MAVRQEKNESLDDYVKRFNEGKGWLSFGQALFRLVKSTHILHAFYSTFWPVPRWPTILSIGIPCWSLPQVIFVLDCRCSLTLEALVFYPLLDHFEPHFDIKFVAHDLGSTRSWRFARCGNICHHDVRTSTWSVEVVLGWEWSKNLLRSNE